MALGYEDYLQIKAIKIKKTHEKLFLLNCLEEI